MIFRKHFTVIQILKCHVQWHQTHYIYLLFCCFLFVSKQQAVNWQPIASNAYYFASASQTRDVGIYTAELIDYLISERSANPKMMQIIGHSLGAHAAGYAGSYIKNGRVGRITGRYCYWIRNIIIYHESISKLAWHMDVQLFSVQKSTW